MRVAAVTLTAAAVVPVLPAQERPAALLTHVAEYIAAYERRFSVLVAEEHYVQTIQDATLADPGAAAFGRDGSDICFRPDSETRC